MLKRMDLARAVVIAALGIGIGLAGAAGPSVAQDMKKDDKMKTGDTMKSSDQMMKNDKKGEMKGDTTMKGGAKGDMKAGDGKKDDKMMEKK